MQEDIIDKLCRYKSIVQQDKTYFVGGFNLNIGKKGDQRWIAKQDSIEHIFVNLKRTVSNRNKWLELDNLFGSIQNNTFTVQFKKFAKYYTNSYGVSTDINIGQCPSIKTKIPKNIHFHDKKLFLTIIIEWYISYLSWRQKIVNSKKTTMIESKTTSDHDQYPTSNHDDTIPDSLDKEDETDILDYSSVTDNDVPDSWEDHDT